MTDADDVRGELARLARGHPPERTRERDVQRATRATEDVEHAAAFVAAGGRERLRTAIATDECDGDADRAARIRAALAAFERFERACEPR